MSNLIKNAYFNVNSEGRRVIDSDGYAEAAYPELFQNIQEESDVKKFKFAELTVGTNINENGEQGFQDGMNIISMDDVIEEQKQILSEQLEIEKNAILENANEEAAAIIASAQQAADAIRDQAYEDGKAQGVEEGHAQGLKELESRKADLQSEFDERFDELKELENSLEPKFADIMTGLIEKITGVVCEDKKDVIVYLIDNALHNLEKTKQITLRVSKDDIGIVTEKREDFIKGLKGEAEFEIVEDASLVHNQCIIESDHRIVDCSIDAQLDNLKEQIKMMAI